MNAPNRIEALRSEVPLHEGLMVQGRSGQAPDRQDGPGNHGNVLLAVGSSEAPYAFAPTTNGQLLGLQTLTELTTIATAQQPTTFTVPAAAVLLGVSVRVNQAITGPGVTGFDVKVGRVRFNVVSPVSPSVGATDPGTAPGPVCNGPSPQPVTLQIRGGPPTGGSVRVTAHFYTVQPPTLPG
jgi:hypothetical protein